MSSERRLEEIFMEASMSPKKDEYMRGYGDGFRDGAAANAEALNEFVGWVESWVTNPVGAYSVMALDGLFAATREKIVALSKAEGTAPYIVDENGNKGWIIP